MELNEKIQELRKQRGLTQEELANALFVSRTAISKWESGRGYPSIDSLRALSAFFGVTIDALLSGDELLTVAEADRRQTKTRFQDLIFGLLDCSTALFFFLPFFRQASERSVLAVSLLSLSGVAAYLKTAYLLLVAALLLWGIVTLALQTCQQPRRVRNRRSISLVLNIAGVLLFIISSQPYAATFSFVFLSIKVLVLSGKQ